MLNLRFHLEFNQIRQKIPPISIIEQKSLSLLKIIIIIITIYFIVKMTFWISEKDDCIVVQPFEMAGTGENLDGKALASFLSFDLQKIKDIYGQQPDILKSESGNEILPRPFGDFSLPAPSVKDLQLDYSISQIGTVGAEGTSISIGNLLISMKGLFSNPNTVSCCLQRCNSTITLVAILKDSHSTKAFEVDETQDKTKLFDNGQILPLISDLAYQISLELSKRNQPKETDPYPQSWMTFKNLTLGRDAFNSYKITNDIKYLDYGRNAAFLANKTEPSYKRTSELLSDIGFAYLCSNNYTEAEKIFLNIARSRPFESALALGIVYYNQNDSEKALNSFDEAIQLNSQDALAWYAWIDKAVVLIKENKLDEAIQASDKAIQINRQNALAWDTKGAALLLKRNYYESIQASDKAIKINPQDALAWGNKGLADLCLGRNDTSLEESDMAIKINPQYAKAWFIKCIALYYLGEYKEALQALNKTIDLDQAYRRDSTLMSIRQRAEPALINAK